MCTLSDEQLPGVKKVKRKVLPMSQSRGDGKELFHDVFPVEDLKQISVGVCIFVKEFIKFSLNKTT